jgi:integrase/recombinase XerD
MNSHLSTESRLRQATAEWLLKKKSANTRAAYRRDLEGDASAMEVPGWLVWCADRSLSPLNAINVHVNAYVCAMEAAGCSRATVARRLSVISSWYTHLLAEEICARNPVTSVTRPEIDRDVSRTTGLDKDETARLLATASVMGIRSSALVQLLLYTGLRVGTVLLADVGDLGYDGRHRTLEMTSKGRTVRRASIPSRACEALGEYLAARGDPADSEPLFATATGERLDEPYVWRLVRRIGRKAQIPSAHQVSPHSLRHTFATQARDLGAPSKTLSEPRA